MLTLIGYIAGLIAIIVLIVIDLAQRREIAQLTTRNAAQAAAHERAVQAAYRRGWNSALAKAYPYGVVPERVKCPGEEIKIAAP